MPYLELRARHIFLLAVAGDRETDAADSQLCTCASLCVLHAYLTLSSLHINVPECLFECVT